MKGAIRAFMATSIAMLASSGTPVTANDPLQGYQFTATPFTATQARHRNRFPGKARPAGSKLARKAANGRVGISPLR